MNKQENWIEETLSMADEIRRVEPGSELMARLKAIPAKTSVLYNSVPKRVVWTAAASLTLLFCLNFLSVKKYGGKDQQRTEYSESYFSYLKQL